MDKLLSKLDMGGNCSKQFYCLDGVESEDGEEEGVGTDKVLSKLVKGGKRMEQIKVKYIFHYRRVFFLCRLRKRSAFYLSVESLDSSTSTVKFLF
jgi:hypothetical protein